MTKHLKLFTPGPGDVDEDILDEMAHPVLRHYGPEWMEIYTDTIGLLQQIFKTENQIFIVPGPASALMDMTIGSLVSSGEEFVAGSNGFFGDRLFDIAQGYGALAVPFTAEQGQPLEPEALRLILRQHPRARVVALVHHETGTTVLNPLRELAQVCREAGRVLVVDAVSSMGGVELPVNAWGVDVCVTAANKCLEALPGVAFISVSSRAWELAGQQPPNGHGWYLNLRTWRKYVQEWGSWHPSPVTLPVNNILAVRRSMHKILDRGLEAHHARYTFASQAVRRGLGALGFEMLVPEAYAAPIVTGVRAHPGFSVAEMSQWLVRERQIAVGGGLGPLAGKIFRVGHLGKAAEREYLVEFLFAVEEFMRFKGLDIPIGAALTGLAAQPVPLS